jgi:uncharacterized protein DUF3107
VEVRIGVQHSPRELTLESNQSQDEVEAAVTKALGAADGLLTLLDDKGRKVIVPAAKLAYVELGESESRRVGFIAG